MKSALIAGATGLTGRSLLYNLLQNKNYIRIFILVRKELAIKDSKLTQIIFNYDNPADYNTLPETDETYCCLGTTIRKAGSQEAFTKVDLEYPVLLANKVKEKGCKKFLIITALGADVKSRFFYNRIKGEVEQAIQLIEPETLYICRPSLLLGPRVEFRLGEEIGKVFAIFISFFLFGTLKKYRAIKSTHVACAMIRLAEKNQKGVYIIESDQLYQLGKQ